MRNNSSFPSYVVPLDVIEAVRKGFEYQYQANENLTSEEFFECAENLLKAVKSDDLCDLAFIDEVDCNNSMADTEYLRITDLARDEFLSDVNLKEKIKQKRNSNFIPSRCEEDAFFLARNYDFSGGQIENITRKNLVSFILNGTAADIKILEILCKEELMEKAAVRIGF